MTLRTTTRTLLVSASLTATLMAGGVALADGFYADEAGSGTGAASSQQTQSLSGDTSLASTSNGSVTFQIPGDWEHFTYKDDGVTFDAYRSDQGVFQVASVDSARTPDPADTRRTLDFIEELAGDVDIDDDDSIFGESQTREVDGVTMLEMTYSEFDDGRETQGIVTVVYGEQTTVAISAYRAEDAQAVAGTYQQVHQSLTPGGAPSGGGFYADESGSAQALGDVAPGDVLIEDDFEYVVSDDPSTYVRVTVTDAASGSVDLIGVPVTLTNRDDEPERPDTREIVLSGPSGRAQVTDAATCPEDSVYGVGRVGRGESVTAMLYFVDEGAGNYTVSFVDDDRDDRHEQDDTMTIVLTLE